MKRAISLSLLLLMVGLAASVVQAQQKSESRAKELANEAKILIDNSRFDEALVSLEEAIKIEPDSAVAHHQIGRAFANKFFSTKQAAFEAKARAALNRAIEIDPSLGDAYFILGRINYSKKNFDGAVADYERATKADPWLEKAYMEKWRLMLKREEFEREVPKIRAEVESLLKRSENREAALEIAASGYEMIADESALKEAQDQLLAQHPKNKLSQMIMLGRIFRETDSEKQAGLAETFVVRYPENPNASIVYEILFLTRIVQDGVSDDRIIELGQAWIKTASKDADSMRNSRAKVIIAFAERGVALDRTKELADETVKIFDEMKPDSNLLSGFDPVTKEQLIKNGRESAHIARGFLLIKLGKTAEAAKELKGEFDPVIREVEKSGYALWKDMHLRDLGARPRVLWLAELYERDGDYTRAARYLLAGYGEDERANRFIQERLPIVYKKLGRDNEQASKDVQSAQARFRSLTETMRTLGEQDRKKSLAQRVRMPAADFTVTRLDKKPASLRDFKGKVIVLNFWATWCGPCVAEMPHLQKMVEKYKNEPDIVFLAVSVDENRAAVSPFLRKNGYTMTVAYDTDAAQNYGVQGVPTTFFIDRNGVIQFKDEGFGDDPKAYLDVMTWRIDALLKENRAR